MGVKDFFNSMLEKYKEDRDKEKVIRAAEKEAYYKEKLNRVKDFAKVKVSKELETKKQEVKNKSVGGWKAPSAEEIDNYILGGSGGK